MVSEPLTVSDVVSFLTSLLFSTDTVSVSVTTASTHVAVDTFSPVLGSVVVVITSLTSLYSLPVPKEGILFIVIAS